MNSDKLNEKTSQMAVSESTKPPLMKPPLPRFSMPTPSASPPVSHSPSPRKLHHPVAKRPRLASTSSGSFSPLSTSKPVTSIDIDYQALHDARRASSQRVLSLWESLAQRYARPMDEDDIIDLRSGKIIKDRGIVRNAKKAYPIGYFADPDEAASTGGEAEHTELEAADGDTNPDPPDSFASDPGIPPEFQFQKMAPLREMNPADAEDLKEFMEAEKMRKELCGSDDDGGEDESALASGSKHGGLANSDEDCDSESSVGSQPAPLKPLKRPPGFRFGKAGPALTLPEGIDSEDELAIAAWSVDEPTLSRPHKKPDDVIDLTTPSPPGSPGGSPQPNVTQSGEQLSLIPRAETPLSSFDTSPPRSPFRQLQTPPSSRSETSPSLDTPPPPPISYLDPTPRPRPQLIPAWKKQLSPEDPSCSAPLRTSITPLQLKVGPSKRTKPKARVEVVIPLRRSVSRARSLASNRTSNNPRPPNESPGASGPPLQEERNNENEKRPSTPTSAPTLPSGDSPSPPPPPRWKPRFSNVGVQRRPSPPHTPVSARERKRKRVVSQSSRPGGSSSESSSACNPPLSRSQPAKKSSVKTRMKTKPQSPFHEMDDTHTTARHGKQRSPPSLHTHDPKRSPGPSTSYTPATSYTPHHDRDGQPRGGPNPRYPSIPPTLPIQGPQAQYLFAQAVHQLSYLMSGAMPSLPPDYVPPYPPSHQKVWPPYTPTTHQINERPRYHSRPVRGPSSSPSSGFLTPSHQPHPYPFTFDPGYSSGTLPPSSSPPSSPTFRSSPLPGAKLRPALARERSRSRGRRVSFRLDDEGQSSTNEEEMANTTADVSMDSVRSPSPEFPRVPRGRNQSRGRQESPEPSVGRANSKQTAEEKKKEPKATKETERGRTPGPPASERGQTVRKK